MINRDDHCPARGVGLSHVVDPRHGPKCVHCGAAISVTNHAGWSGSEPPSPPEPEPKPSATVFDHRYIQTITRACGRCGEPEDKHVKFIKPDEPGGCVVDHKSIANWTLCPSCNTTVEPKLATGITSGRTDGKGRMPWTERQLAGLDSIRSAWVGGYYKS